MAPKTLDLNTHAKTFADTYAHARRTGADRPLAQRFGLADVLGEIEEIIAKRIETQVARTKAVAETHLQSERSKHAAELASAHARAAALEARLAPITASTITADRIVSRSPRPRFVVENGDVRDRLQGDRAPFGSDGVARSAADALNRGSRSKTSLFWTYRPRRSSARYPF